MKKEKEYTLDDGTTLEWYNNGVVVLKDNGKVKGRHNPTENFEAITKLGGGNSAHRKRDEKEVDAILDALNVDDKERPIARRLALSWVEGKGDSGFRSAMELLTTFGWAKDRQSFEIKNKDATIIVYDGEEYFLNTPAALKRLWGEKKGEAMWQKILTKVGDYFNDQDGKYTDLEDKDNFLKE